MTTQPTEGFMRGAMPPSGTIARLLRNAVDIHVHAGPDPRIERRMDAGQVALYAQELGQRGFVLKSHDYPTTPLVHLMERMAPQVRVFGSVTLDEEVGGINPHAVLASAKIGCRMVFMPTHSSLNDRRKHGSGDTGITIFDPHGQITHDCKEVLKLVKEYDMVLSTAHLSTQETFALVEEARRMGIRRVLVAHVLLGFAGADLTVEQVVQLADMGAMIEFSWIACTAPRVILTPEKVAEAVKVIGVSRCIISTDYGQFMNPPPPEGMRTAIAHLLRVGMKAEEVEALVGGNPARLMGLE